MRIAEVTQFQKIQRTAEVQRFHYVVCDMDALLSTGRAQGAVERGCVEEGVSAEERGSAEECSSRPQFMRCRECNCMVDLALLEEHGLVCCTGEEAGDGEPLQV